MRIKSQTRNGLTKIQILLQHPMENGLRNDPDTGELLPENYIQMLTCKWGDQVVFIADFGRGVSANPYLSFSFLGGRIGDPFTVFWVDNKGQKKIYTATLK